MHEITIDLTMNQLLSQNDLVQVNGGRTGGQHVIDEPFHAVPVWYVDPETGEGFWL